MPFKFDEQVRRCYDRASSYRARAAAEQDPQLRQLLNDLEERWLNLAQSYEITDRLLRTRYRASVIDPGHAIKVDLDKLLKALSGPDSVVERKRVRRARARTKSARRGRVKSAAARRLTLRRADRSALEKS